MLKENINNPLKDFYRAKRSLEFIKQFDAEHSWQRLMKKHQQHRFRHMIQRVTSWAACAAFLVGFSYFSLNYYKEWQQEQQMALLKELYPEKGSPKAILQLENDKEIDLTAHEQTISPFAHNIKGEQLVYTQLPSAGEEQTAFNTLSVPRGGEYQVILADGTHIFLNAESTLRYPVLFEGNSREVYLEGEGYFEVAPNKEMPFIVHTQRGTVEVLGTQFNLSAYSDNPMHMELVRGSVRVSTPRSNIVCTPNQQIVVADKSGRMDLHEVDASLWASWATGIYRYQDMPLRDIAAQLARWYNVDIRFRQPELEEIRFSGAIMRNEELAFAVDVIEHISSVQFIRSGNTVWIMKKEKENDNHPSL